MLRIVSILTRVSAACRTAVSRRALADAAARALSEAFPDASVIAFEHDARSERVRAVAGARIPEQWHMRAVRLHDVPLIAAALRSPDRLARGSALSRQPPDGRDPSAPGRLDAICAAVPGGGDPAYALLLLAPPADPAESELRAGAIEATRQLLAAAAAAGSAGRSRMLAAIHRAKREWEQAADALPDIVGVIDSRRRVLRVSRALEHWSLGEVRGAIGRDLHALFHPRCADAACGLDAALHGALAALANRSPVTIELADPQLERDLVVILSAASEPGGLTPNAPWRRIAFMVLNVTSLRRFERELVAMTRTLEQRLEHRTEVLSRASDALRAEVNRRRAAESSLRATRRELDALSEQLVNARANERKPVAQHAHDVVAPVRATGLHRPLP